MVESLSSDGLNLDRSSTEVVAFEVGQNIMLTGNNLEVINANRSSNSPDVVLWTTSSGEQGGSFQTSWTNSNGTVASSPTTPSTPLNTPLSSVGATPQSTPQSSLIRGAQARQPAYHPPPLRTSTTSKSSPGHPPSWTPQWRSESSKYSVSKLRGNQVCHLIVSVVGSTGHGTVILQW